MINVFSSEEAFKGMCEELGINIGGFNVYEVQGLVSKEKENINYCMDKILEDKKIPVMFKKEDVTSFSVFIKERIDEAIQILTKERDEKEAYRKKEYGFYVEAMKELHAKFEGVEDILTRAITHHRNSGKGDAQETLLRWGTFKDSIRMRF